MNQMIQTTCDNVERIIHSLGIKGQIDGGEIGYHKQSGTIFIRCQWVGDVPDINQVMQIRALIQGSNVKCQNGQVIIEARVGKMIGTFKS